MSEPGNIERRTRLVEESLRRVGPRPMPSEEATARAYARAQEAWQQLARQQVRRRYWWLGIGSLAASLLIAAILIAFWPPARALEPAGIVARASGPASYLAPGSSSAPIQERDVVAIGATIETAPHARVALELATGHSLRLDTGTRIEIVSRNEYRLEQGRIYVDSQGADDRETLRIATPIASVTEIGTQFQVQWPTPHRALEVRVRDGSVMLAANPSSGPPNSVSAGEAAVLAQGQALARRADASFGAAWAWVAAISPGLDPQAQRLEQVLAWVCRELGYRLRYADAQTQDFVARVELDGSLQGLTPAQTLEVLEQITSFHYRSAAGELIVAIAESSSGRVR